MITVAICDDSKPMLESMKACLEEYGNTINHELHIFSFESGEELLNNYAPITEKIVTKYGLDADETLPGGESK